MEPDAESNERDSFNGKQRKRQARRVSRRGFLRAATVAGTLAVVPRHVLGGTGFVAPSEKTTLAGIGLGGQGSQNVVSLMQYPEVQVVAVCDVNRERGGYLSWNWTQGKEQRTAGREPARVLSKSSMPSKGEWENTEAAPPIETTPPDFRDKTIPKLPSCSTPSAPTTGQGYAADLYWVANPLPSVRRSHRDGHQTFVHYLHRVRNPRGDASLRRCAGDEVSFC